MSGDLERDVPRPATLEGPPPVAALIGTPDGPTILLPGRDLTVGRQPSCDVVLATGGGISRIHARFEWRGASFALHDLDSASGTQVDGRAVHANDPVALVGGERVRFGDVEYVFVSLVASTPIATVPRERLEMLRALGSLDPGEVVARGLELLRSVSGVERSYLVGAGREPSIEPLLTPRTDPDLRVSSSAIEQALVKLRKVSHFLTLEGGVPLTRSMAALGLRRIWVAPVTGPDGVPIAAVYLDSPNAGEPFAPDVESTLDTVVAHIGNALRNALLHAQVLDLSQNLERKVEERTRQLEASRAQLVAQDRLATLGRLVAAIAHELNNPVGAIASFANTLRGLVDPLLSLRTDLDHLFPEPDLRARAEQLCVHVLDAARQIAPDSRRRRALESRWLQSLDDVGAGAEGLSQRLARMGLDPTEVADSLPALASKGEALSPRLEHLYTLGRSLETISQCSASVARIVDGLKTYAHLDRSEAEVTDIHRSIQATLSVLGAGVPKSIEVVTRFDTIPPFAHRPGELTQVWTNLVDNAVRAMGESGTLTVETHDDGDHVRVVITDTGPGVPAPMRDRIFELDTTTRGPGAGLGLGLPICRTLVEQNHGGRIGFESRPGRTTFTVELPKSGPAT